MKLISVSVSFFCSINKTTGNSLDYTFFLLTIQHFTFTFHSSRIYFYDYGLRRSIPCFLISYPILYLLCCYYLVLVLFCSPSGWRMRQNIYIHIHTYNIQFQMLSSYLLCVSSSCFLVSNTLCVQLCSSLSANTATM